MAWDALHLDINISTFQNLFSSSSRYKRNWNPTCLHRSVSSYTVKNDKIRRNLWNEFMRLAVVFELSNNTAIKKYNVDIYIVCVCHYGNALHRQWKLINKVIVKICIFLINVCIWSWNNVVSQYWTRLQDGPTRVWNPVGARDFPPFQNLQASLGPLSFLWSRYQSLNTVMQPGSEINHSG